jgi:hypothetical protein
MFELTHSGVHGPDDAATTLPGPAPHGVAVPASARIPAQAAIIPRCLFCRYRSPSEGREEGHA